MKHARTLRRHPSQRTAKCCSPARRAPSRTEIDEMDMEASFSPTSFGKVILAGEHAAVYGHPAVAIGLDRGVRARVKRIEGEHTLLVIGSEVIRATDECDL